MSGMAADRLPTPPPPVTTLRTPAAGRPRPPARPPGAGTGPCSGRGLMTTALPVARAGPSFQAAIRSRVVPRHDRADDAERLADDHRQGVRPGRRDLVVELVGRLGVPADGAGGIGDVDRSRVADRLADVEGLDPGELLGVGVDQVGEAEQDPLAVGRRASPPSPCAAARAPPRPPDRRPRRRPPRPRRSSARSPGSRPRRSGR